MKELNRKLLYEISLSILAIVTVTIAIMDLTGSINANSQLLLLDNYILAIFAVDYFARLFLAQNRWGFFKSNVFDLIAIIPFSSLFRIFRLARLFRILRLTRMFRMAIFFKRLTTLSKSFLHTNGFLYVVYITIVTILVGAIAIYYAERGVTINGFGDAVWWSFVTATTVGYGDISPVTGLGRAIAAVIMLTGIGFIGMLTGTIATFFLSNRKGETTMNRSKVVDLSNLSDDDFAFVLRVISSIKKDTETHGG